MKRTAPLLPLIIFVFISCKKIAVENYQPNVEETTLTQQRPSCGMEEAMSTMSPEMKSSLVNSTRLADGQAGELLLFLDFDGAVVRAGFPNSSGYNSPIISGVRNCPPSTLSELQKAEVIALVRDDFSPFNIIVTTDQSVFNGYPSANKQICIITTMPSIIGFPAFVGGVSPFAGPGFRLASNPSFVFSSVYGSQLADIAGVISHEVGHSMGLAHQHLFSPTCGFVNEYHPGFGTGQLSFVPIMGEADDKRITNWYSQNCNLREFGVPQNDFALLSSQVVLREDDFPGTPAGQTVSEPAEITGILEQEGDIDFIRINFRNPGDVTISSENADLKVSVYSPGGNLLGVYEDPNDTGVTIPGLRGNRFLKIEAIGNVNMSTQFMTGQYRIQY